MTYEVKEATDDPGVFWIEDEDGQTICDFYQLKPFSRSRAYPNAKANAELICKTLNQREETK